MAGEPPRGVGQRQCGIGVGDDDLGSASRLPVPGVRLDVAVGGVRRGAYLGSTVALLPQRMQLVKVGAVLAP